MSALLRISGNKASPIKTIGLIAGPLLFIYFQFFTNLSPEQPAVSATLAVAVLMAVWWVTEAVPLAITSLLPVALFPLLSIMDGKDVSSTYFNHVIFLFIGGFMVALAMQKWDLHKRIALRILMVTGVSPGRILLGFMLATAFLSMWISNTATTMMMVPILISIIVKLEEIIGEKNISRYSIGLLLGVAYSASIGGIATLVGTPPNLSFARIFQIMFPAAPDISFANWFLFAFPVTFIFFIIVWIYLYLLFKPKTKILGCDISGIVKEVGSQVKTLKEGDEVYGDISESGFGGFAEYVSVDEKALAKKPPKMTFEEAAATSHAAMLAVQGLFDKGKIQKGQKVLINGAGGGVGTLGIQIIKEFNCEVTGVDSADKFEIMRSMGYDHVIDYKTEDSTKNGKQYDLILDTKTNRPIRHYVRSLSPNGKYVTVGGLTSKLMQVLYMAPFISLFNKKKICLVVLKPNKDLDYINKLFEDGKLKYVLDGPYNLSELPKAMQYYGEGKHKGKVVITL